MIKNNFVSTELLISLKPLTMAQGMHIYSYVNVN